MDVEEEGVILESWSLLLIRTKKEKKSDPTFLIP